MKVIEILNKIANGEKIHFIVEGAEYYVGADGYLKDQWCDDALWDLDYEWLNTEVEIIEEKKIPEKLPKWATTREDKEYTKQEDNILIVSQKVDEIIDYLKSKGE